jgi:hypothetical protein
MMSFYWIDDKWRFYVHELPDGVHILSEESQAILARAKAKAAEAAARFTKRSA